MQNKNFVLSYRSKILKRSRMELPVVKGAYRFNYPLAKTTWFQVGGPAEILFKPYDTEDLAYFLSNKPKELYVTILGLCSNMIIRDGGIQGVVVKLGKNFTHVEILENNMIKVGAGATNYNVANFCADNNLTGLEFLIGIPGAIGGGIAMNAGCYGSEFKDYIVNVKAVDFDGNIHILSSKELNFSYRACGIKNMIFTEVVFQLSEKPCQEIRDYMQQIMQKRQASQPIRAKTGGSSFKNPPKSSAWRLIDEAGLRGFKLGGAIVSDKHCNFIINEDNATAEELENLLNHIQQEVHKLTSVKLEREIKIIGSNVKK